MLRPLLPVLPVALIAAFAWAGCMSPLPPSARVSEAARDLNVNSRFGDVGSLTNFTAPAFQQTFLSRRAQWGNMVRVVDVELAGMTMKDSSHASVSVDFSWTRVDQGTLMTTRVAQEWEDDGGWKLVREKRISGDIGLFGEPSPKPAEQAPRQDVQFATTVIR
ncbi:MAG TPA: hypothetical protein VGK73_19105 [Polyangiaceae bacterium]